MPFCTKCGKEAGTEDNFCRHCGAATGVVTAVPPSKPDAKPPVGDTFTDPRDGQTYRTVKIGNQIWLAENLRYNAALTDETRRPQAEIYGNWYMWDNAKKACPLGWRLPTVAEWEQLEKIVGGVQALKSKALWEGRGNGTDDYGFSALPGGNNSAKTFSYDKRPHGDRDRGFNGTGYSGWWWTGTGNSTRAVAVHMHAIDITMGDGKLYSAMRLSSKDFKANAKHGQYSVRCVKDK